MKIEQITTLIVGLLFLGMGIYIIILQNKVNKILANQKEEIHSLIDQKLTGIDQKMNTLYLNLDSLTLQYDTIKQQQYEILRTNQQAKEQSDRAINLYRDHLFILPPF